MTETELLIAHKVGLRFGRLGKCWAHICVDMQRMFLEATPWQADWMPRVLPAVEKLVVASPERTIFTRFIPPTDLDQTRGTWRRYYERWPMMIRGRLGEAPIGLIQVLARWSPPARVHDKGVYSPWLDGKLHAELRALSVDTVVISGTETEVCVLATVLGAIDHGYRTVVASDAVCSSADETHDAMLGIYNSRFGMQVETAEVDEILEAT